MTLNSNNPTNKSKCHYPSYHTAGLDSIIIISFLFSALTLRRNRVSANAGSDPPSSPPTPPNTPSTRHDKQAGGWSKSKSANQNK
ncbi:hypothetical protein BDW74DRAFT_100687 [Aspergillus multicolor]|uniref:uncharacterized protein n=1 Tax=Aspergillus multicolor TaxID=41759 RepID=UPI003CCD40A7